MARQLRHYYTLQQAMAMVKEDICSDKADIMNPSTTWCEVSASVSECEQIDESDLASVEPAMFLVNQKYSGVKAMMINQ